MLDAAKVVDVAGSGIAQPTARPRFVQVRLVEEGAQIGQARLDAVHIGWRVVEASQVVAFRSFAFHRHRSEEAENVEIHFRQVVIDVLHLARGQHAVVELRDTGAIA